MEEYLDEKALARPPGRKYPGTHKAKPLRKYRKHLRRFEKRQGTWMGQGKKLGVILRVELRVYKL
jgi:hypothetical protein